MRRWRMMWCKRSRGGRSDETVGKGVDGKRGEGGGCCGGREEVTDEVEEEVNGRLEVEEEVEKGKRSNR